MSELLATLNSPEAAKQDAEWRAEVESAATPQEEPKEEASAPQEAPPAEEAKPAAPPVAAAEETPKPAVKEDEKFVPLRALQEARGETSEWKRRFSELENIVKSVKPQAEVETEELDPEKDPIGVIRTLAQQVQSFQQEKQAQAVQAQLGTIYQQAAIEFAAQEPTFKDAYQHIIKSRGNELRAQGIPAHEVNAMLKSEEMSLVASSLQNGLNPAQVLYEMSVSRGFQKQAPETPKPAASAPAVILPDPATLKAKADAATSISGGGKPPANDLTADEAVKTLKGAALDSFLEKQWKQMESSAIKASHLFRA